MLRKLIKYDLKWHNRVFIPLYLISLLFAVLTRCLYEIGKNSMVIHIISLVFAGITYALLANVLINSITRVVAKFVRNIYKDESYLTHTLPVERNTIFLSKILVSIIYMIISIIIIFLSLFIILYTPDNFESLKQGLKITANMYNSSVIIILFSLVVTLTLEFIMLELIGYLGIILGYKSNDNKGIKSLFWGLGLYFGIQIITVSTILVLGLFNSNIMSAITTNTANIDILKTLLWVCNGMYAVFCIILYYVGKKELCKGINVD